MFRANKCGAGVCSRANANAKLPRTTVRGKNNQQAAAQPAESVAIINVELLNFDEALAEDNIAQGSDLSIRLNSIVELSWSIELFDGAESDECAGRDRTL